jgi:hypothetical protein
VGPVYAGVSDPYTAPRPNPYLYADANPAKVTDPLGLYSVEQFSDPDAQQINQGMQRLQNFLKRKPCCTRNFGSSLQSMIENPDLKITYDPTLTICGWTNPVWVLTPEIKIGPAAFDMTQCGPCLAATLIHEISHLYGATDLSTDLFGGSNSAYALEYRCIKGGLCE